ncbi:MAG: methionyl-tRNA formyltransferase [Nitrospiraceae bacterium]|nr:MAG: methionyl-tRNA formyltransferase [Nitrospiraceae bacterium]
MRVVYFGTPEFAVLPFKALLHAGHEVVAVVTQPDRQSGRGRQLKSCPVKMEAHKAGLRILQPGRVRDPEFIDILRALNPEAVVVAAYGQILPGAIIHLPELGCINIHASLLPAYRGAAPINWAIINGEGKTGITTMLMDEGMDTGPVLLKRETEISADDTAGSLSLRLSKIGAELLIPTLKGLESGEVKPVPQAGEVSYAPLLKKEDGLIDWSKSAEELCRFINGMNPWPGAFSVLENERVKIIKAIPLDGRAEAGTIDRAGKDGLIAGTGTGRLSILEIQPSGKAVMPVRAYLQGRRLKEGMKFSMQTRGNN